MTPQESFIELISNSEFWSCNPYPYSAQPYAVSALTFKESKIVRDDIIHTDKFQDDGDDCGTASDDFWAYENLQYVLYDLIQI